MGRLIRVLKAPPAAHIVDKNYPVGSSASYDILQQLPQTVSTLEDSRSTRWASRLVGESELQNGSLDVR